jgi:FkbM family methyltransferase
MSIASRVAPFARRILRPLGVDLIRHPYRPLFAHLADLIPLLGVDCALDVGAHHGEWASALRNAGFRGRIVSFEPASEAYRALERASSGDPEWLVHRVALGAADEERELNITKETQLASFRATSAAGKQHLRDYGVERVDAVRVRRLDSVFPECVRGLENPRVLLKLDTQGWDLEVLRGAQTTLAHVVALQIELSLEPLYEGAPQYLDALTALDRLDYVPTGFFLVARLDAARVLELDCVLRRRDEALK